MKIKIKIRAIASNNNLIIINADAAKDLGLSDKKVSYIAFGVAKCYVEVKTSDNIDYHEIGISNNVIECLRTPEYISYEIRCDGDAFILGPAIGFLLSRKKESITPKSLNAALAYVSQYQLLNGAVIIFSLDCVNKKDHTISGYCYNPENNSWEKGVFPYPSAIYRRLALSEEERNHFLEVIGDKLYYNYYFSKWKMYQWFSKNKEMSMYFPHTILYNSSYDIEAMLRKYSRIHAKPLASSGGKGVIQISYEDGKIIYKYRKGEKNQQIRFDSMNSAKVYGAKLLKKRKYILQQSINLIKYKRDILDLRCMMLRDDKNKWECSAIVGRIAANGSVVSNAHSGGTPAKFDVIFRNYLGYSEGQFNDIKKNIESIAIKAAETLDDYGIKAAVLGIDIGVDTKGKLWIIEINIRYPGLDLFTFIGDYQIVEKTKTSLMLYGKYLAGFGPST